MQYHCPALVDLFARTNSLSPPLCFWYILCGFVPSVSPLCIVFITEIVIVEQTVNGAGSAKLGRLQYSLNRMAILGIHIATNQLRYAVLDGTRTSPLLLAKDRLLTPDPKHVPALMDWFESQFTKLVEEHSPIRIACRVTLQPKKAQLFTSCFPLGVLYLIAHKRNLPVSDYVVGNYVPSRLNLPKGTNLYEYCDSIFGEHPPYWDDSQKHAVLAAWFELS